MPKRSILVVGSANTDMIVKAERIPKPGETILGGEFVTAAGGKGANQAVAAARAGGAVTFVARLGTDVFGDQAVAGLAAAGVNVDYVTRDAANASGVALIFVGANGENSIAVAPGANAQLSPADLAKARDAFDRATIVVLQLETPLETVGAAIRMAAQAGARVILNPAPAQALHDGMLEGLFLLTPNAREAELLTGLPLSDQASAFRAADALLARGVLNVMITLGAQGAILSGTEGRGVIAAHEVKALDTTGAGDVFNGALAVALAKGKGLVEAGHFASAAAAISVTRLGAQASAPLRKEIDRFLFSLSAVPVEPTMAG
jgi:ribokinase